MSETPTVVAPAPKKKGPSKKVIAGAAIVVLLALAAIGGSKTPTPASTDTPPPIGATDQPAAATQQPPAAGPVTLLDLTGKGIKSSRTFTTTDPWTIAYTFDCTSFGFAGNFQVTVEDSSGTPVAIAVNELAKKGGDSTQVYQTGDLHLSMNSECDWHVKATQP